MSLNLNHDQLTLVANTIRVLSAEAVEKANSGHPGMPMGVAEFGAALWLGHLRLAPQDPGWLARDRFVLSNGHGSMFLYTMLHLSGFDLSLEDLKQFRQWESKTPGHPESFMTPGVECTTGPLGQGIANAVGMAIAQKVQSERYRGASFDPFDHRVFCVAGDGCLMEGISGEASSVAGHLGLDNLVVLYDDNHISIAGDTNLAFTEDVAKRYEAYGWRVESVDGHNFAACDAAITNALAETGKPTLIAARTTIGKGSPNKADTSGVHGSPLGADELELTKKELGWQYAPFEVPQEVSAIFASRRDQHDADYQQWQKDFSVWSEEDPDRAQRLARQLGRELPSDVRKKFFSALPDEAKPIATRKLSHAVLQVASKEMDSLIGGSADLEPSTLTLIKDSSDIAKGSFGGLNLRFGVREHAMGAIMNGLSYYGGFTPYGSTFLVFSDYMRPAIRLAALSDLPGLFVFTHDSVFLGEDGPTHQPIEHLASLRMIPNLEVFRPADAVETAICYELALSRKDGPSAMVFTRQNVPPIERSADFDPEVIARGAYSVFDSGEEPQLLIVATGSEVGLALEVAKQLSDKVAIRVVSMPSVERFIAQSEDYRAQLLPRGAKRVVIEAASTFGWSGIVGGAPEDRLLVGIDRFGASAPYQVLTEKFGFTPEAVIERIKEKFPNL